MKKNSYFFLVCFLAMLSVVVTSCKKDDPDPKLSVSDYSIPFGPNGGQFELYVTSNVKWSITCNEDWISVSPTEGSKNQTVIVTADANKTSEKKNAILTVRTEDGSLSQRVDVEIAGMNINLSVSPSSIEFESTIGDIKHFTINCNGDWNIENTPDWLDINPLAGNGTKSVELKTIKQNTEDRTRSSILVIKSADKTAEIEVSQISEYSTNCKVTPSTVVTLANGFAMDFNYSSNVFQFYIGAFSKAKAERMTDQEIINSMLQDDYCTPTDGYVISCQNLNALTEYWVYTLAYDKNNKAGKLVRTEITTKSERNQPLAVISDVSYDETTWRYTTTPNAYSRRYYKCFMPQYSHNAKTTDAALAWYFKQILKDNPNDSNLDPVTNAATWTRGRMSNESIFFVVTWAQDENYEFSGVIDSFYGTISDSAKGKAKAIKAKNSGKIEKVITYKKDFGL